MIRVLHIIPSLRPENGGPNEALRRYAAVLSGHVLMDVISTTEGLSSMVDREQVQESLGCRLLLFGHYGSHSRNISPAMYRWLWGHVKDYQIVHLHACFSPNTTVAAWICRRKRIPYIIRPLGTLSSYGVGSGHAWLKRAYLGLFERATVGGAEAVHFTAEEERLTMVSRLRYHRHAVIPIPFLEGECSKNHLPDGRLPRSVLFLSRIHPKKALDILLLAFRRALEHDREIMSDVRLTIAGTGELSYVDSLKASVSDLESSGYVVWMGFVRGAMKSDLLANSSIFCLPSYQENFGVAVAEAMAAGLPVIISDQVALYHDVLEYDAGKVVPAGDIEKLASAITEMLRDRESMKRQAHNARSLVAVKYGHIAVRDALLALYRSITSQSGRGTTV